MSNDKKQDCKHDWARIWLVSKGYQETKYCRKCLELWNATKRPRQESPQT